MSDMLVLFLAWLILLITDVILALRLVALKKRNNWQAQMLVDLSNELSRKPRSFPEEFLEAEQRVINDYADKARNGK